MTPPKSIRQRIQAARSRNPNCIPPCDYDENCTACDIEIELKAAIDLLDSYPHEFFTEDGQPSRIVADPEGGLRR